jgi:hypothetical protein
MRHVVPLVCVSVCVCVCVCVCGRVCVCVCVRVCVVCMPASCTFGGLFVEYVVPIIALGRGFEFVEVAFSSIHHHREDLPSGAVPFATVRKVGRPPVCWEIGIVPVCLRLP